MGLGLKLLRREDEMVRYYGEFIENQDVRWVGGRYLRDREVWAWVLEGVEFGRVGAGCRGGSGRFLRERRTVSELELLHTKRIRLQAAEHSSRISSDKQANLQGYWLILWLSLASLRRRGHCSVLRQKTAWQLEKEDVR